MSPVLRRLASKLAPTAALLLLSGAAVAGVSPVKKEPKPWTESSPAIAEHIRRGGAFVTFVVVPLCSNDQIDCGSSVAGRPGDLSKNIYWGAIFGQRRFFERKNSGWTLVEATRPPPGNDDPLLERVVFKRRIPLAAWSNTNTDSDTNTNTTIDPSATAEQIVVFQAVHGASIDRAVGLFWSVATEGGRVRFHDGEKHRDEPIHVAGYAGHNRLMDPGKNLPPPPPIARSRPIPSFVIACYSEPYFGAALRNAGSDTLVMTRNLMAPEGYVLDALAKFLGDNAPREHLRRRSVEAYAKWQNITTREASSIFTPSL